MVRLLVIIAFLLPAVPVLASPVSVASVRPPHHEHITLKMRRHSRNWEMLRARPTATAEAPHS